MDASEWDMTILLCKEGTCCQCKNECVAESAGYDFATECTDVPNETGF